MREMERLFISEILVTLPQQRAAYLILLFLGNN